MIPVKSGPTSGPFTVSSQVIQEPHGMLPPAQFIIVPFKLVEACLYLAGAAHDGGRASAAGHRVIRAREVAERCTAIVRSRPIPDEDRVTPRTYEGAHAIVATR